MNINVHFRVFVKASHSVFLKKHKNTNNFFFLESSGQTFVENAMILTCAKIQKKNKCFVKLEPLKFFDGAENYMSNEPPYFLSIRFILNNPRFNN